MGHSVTLGGERVGSGNKNKVYLHNYERSTHNLSRRFTSSMGVGMLIPFLCELVTRDDKFEIDLSAGLRTIPTKGPLFGSFKLQLDVYQCPLRLYQALLHNNPLAIGLKANQIKFPKIRLYDNMLQNEETRESKSATNSLVKYLGISGIGTLLKDTESAQTYYRDLFGSGVLAYYDIFKNYYANKQEENAYTLTSRGQEIEKIMPIYERLGYDRTISADIFERVDTGSYSSIVEFNSDNVYSEGTVFITFAYNCMNDVDTEQVYKDLLFSYQYVKFETYETGDEGDNLSIKELQSKGIVKTWSYVQEKDNKTLHVTLGIKSSYPGADIGEDFFIKQFEALESTIMENGVTLNSFKLANIDKMRMDILSAHTLGQSFVVDGANGAYEPYISAVGTNLNPNWQNNLAGLCVKTYQSDIFNNWINTEWIDGENGIAAITAISTSDGKITIDALNFSEKLYNLLNRIAVSGATYEDYLDAAYTDSAKKFCEAPMWLGGMSDEIVFEEIVQTAPADGDPLGTLGGRGNLKGKTKGGKITCKIDEPSLIIGIVSITPRINYTQGNEWFNTEIDSLMDIHVPALDAIAFQNLLGERLHFASTILKNDGTYEERPIIGKIPAWLEYMTSYDRAYGDFAATDGDGYMILQRDYLCEEGILKDATTYIDPAKYNYAFAYTKRDAQNFWVSITAKIKARRLMSAKQIPSV